MTIEDIKLKTSTSKSGEFNQILIFPGIESSRPKIEINLMKIVKISKNEWWKTIDVEEKSEADTIVGPIKVKESDETVGS